MPTGTIRITPIPLGFVNAYLLRGEQAVLIDTGNPGSADRILCVLAEQGLAPGDLSLIVLTHGHGDHIGSSAVLKEKTGAKVAIHVRDADALRTGRGPDLTGTNAVGSVFAALLPRSIRGFKPFEPDILLDGECSLLPYGIAGKVVPTPGHTAGSVSVVLENGTAFAGDTLMGGMGRKGKPRFPLFAEDRAQAETSIALLVGQNLQTVYTGHGGPFSLDELRAAF